jgi:hypothetical protein
VCFVLVLLFARFVLWFVLGSLLLLLAWVVGGCGCGLLLVCCFWLLDACGLCCGLWLWVVSWVLLGGLRRVGTVRGERRTAKSNIS